MEIAFPDNFLTETFFASEEAESNSGNMSEH